MKGIASLVTFALWSGVCLGVTVYVPEVQPTIQAGIDAASDFDTVLVADGVYTGDGNRDILFYGKSVKLISENGPENCIIDCEATAEDPHRGVYFSGYETQDALLEGFTVKHAYAQWAGGICFFHSAPVVRNCIVTENGPAGIRCFASGSNPLLENVHIIANSVGMFISGCAPTLTDCIFEDNSGSAIWTLDSSPITITKCDFINNTGAIRSDYDVYMVMTDCLFEGNVTSSGATIYVEFGDSLEMTRCTLRGCEPRPIYLMNCHYTATDCIFEENYGLAETRLVILDAICQDPVFRRCIFRNNIGQPLMFWEYSAPTIDSCQFTNNLCSWCVVSLTSHSDGVIKNCTFASNHILYYEGLVIINDYDCPLSISNTLVAYNRKVPPLDDYLEHTIINCNFYGNGGGDWVGSYADQLGVDCNNSLDPQFCDRFIGNFDVYTTSPCLPENNECGEPIGVVTVGCMCGDTDASEAVDIDDVVYLIDYIFSGGPAPEPVPAGDPDCSGEDDIDDVVFIINYIFAGGDEPCAACW
ncbi:MAG: right-handed parallel beta-helix repeat-containing protein [Candidatus Zixiibacteriota bacterium]